MDQLINFYQITPDIGTSGQPTADQLRNISEQGYSSVVNLAMPDSDNAIAEEGKLVTSLGMSYVHIPVPFNKPSADHVRKFIRVMDALEGEKIFVHCAINARVSAFMYKYLTLRKGQSEESATSPVLRSWLPKMDDEWKAIINLKAEELDRHPLPLP